MRRLPTLLLAAALAPAGAAADEVLHLDTAHFVKDARLGPYDHDAARLPWQSRTLPDLWRSWRAVDSGVGWYRVDFELQRVPDQPWALYIAWVHSSWSLRLNTAALAQQADFTDIHLQPQPSHPQLVPLPPALLRAGRNTLDLQVRVENDIHGGLSALQLGPLAQLRPAYGAERTLRADAPRAMAVALALAALFMALLWWRRRSQSLYGWFAALAALWGLRGAYVAGEASWLQALRAAVELHGHDLFLAFTLVFGCALLFALVNRYLARPAPRAERLALVACVAATAGNAPLGRLGFEPLAQAWYAAAVALTAAATWRVWRAMTERPRAEHAWIALALAVLTSTVVHDAATVAGWLPYSPLAWTVYGPPLALAAMIVALGGQWFRAFDEARHLNLALEQRVAERSAELQRQFERVTGLEREAAVAGERERLMRDMHDGVGSQLMTTLGALERGQLGVEQAAALLRECIDDLRLVIDSLDAGPGSLAAALANLRWRLEPRLAAAGLELHWQLDDRVGAALSAGAVLQLLRIVQEALVNALKHARARTLRVSLGTTEAGAMQLEISDDGIGLQPGSGAGRGLTHLRHRAQALGALLELLPAEPCGLTVRVTMPKADLA